MFQVFSMQFFLQVLQKCNKGDLFNIDGIGTVFAGLLCGPFANLMAVYCFRSAQILKVMVGTKLLNITIIYCNTF